MSPILQARVAAADFKDLRRKLGLTQEKMAVELGISTRSIEEYESGRLEIPHTVRAALNFRSILLAHQRQDPSLVTDTTGQIIDELAEMRRLARG